MIVVVVEVAIGVAFGVCSGLIARRKSRSPWRWFLAGFLLPLPGVLMASFAAPAGEPWRMRGPLVLLILIALPLSLAMLAVVSEVFL